jgi:hypothetical protein
VSALWSSQLSIWKAIHWLSIWKISWTIRYSFISSSISFRALLRNNLSITLIYQNNKEVKKAQVCNVILMQILPMNYIVLTYRVNGQLDHTIENIVAQGRNDSLKGQLYFIDPDFQSIRSLQIFSDLDPLIQRLLRLFMKALTKS